MEDILEFDNDYLDNKYSKKSSVLTDLESYV
jgi:hypothetical protein